LTAVGGGRRFGRNFTSIISLADRTVTVSSLMLSTTKGDLEEGWTGAPLAKDAEAAAGTCWPPEECPGRAVVGVASGAAAAVEDEAAGAELLAVVAVAVGEGSLEEEDLGEEASFLAAAALRSTLLRLCVLRLLRFDSVGPSDAGACEEGEEEEEVEEAAAAAA